MAQQIVHALGKLQLDEHKLKPSVISADREVVSTFPAQPAPSPAIMLREAARLSLRLLEKLGLAGGAINHDARLLSCNLFFKKLMPTLIEERTARLHFQHAVADATFSSHLSSLQKSDKGHQTASFAVKAEKWRTPHIAHLLPLHADIEEHGPDKAWILVVLPISSATLVNTSMLEGLFDLTPSEAAIASGLAAGNTLQDIASQRDISVETARTQLKAVMTKTSTNRQAELVGLVSQVRSLTP